jgi:hypothetical protein
MLPVSSERNRTEGAPLRDERAGALPRGVYGR